MDYLAVGHLSVDIFERRIILGGTVTYSSLTAMRLGHSVGMLTSADFEPLLVDTLIGREQMRQPETPIRILRVPAEATTSYVNQYDEHGRTQYVLGRASDLLPIHLPPEWRAPKVVHLAPLAQEVDPSFLTAFSGGLMLITPQGWMRAWDEEGKVSPIPWAYAEAALKQADVTVFSTDDLPDPTLISRYAELARVLVVTENRRGCMVYERGKAPFRSLAFKPARESDPTGAGDVFAAAFAIQFQRTGDARSSADFANCVASFALEKRAWQGIPTAEAVADRLKRGKRRGA